MSRQSIKWAGRIAVLLLAAGLLLAALGFDGAFLADWRSRSALCDLDGDGRAEELVLEGRRLRLLLDGRELWRTERSWKVEDFLTGDIDKDGRPELLLLVWKRGSFGESRPFWVERDELCYSQHIFLFRWDGESPVPLWMSSRLRPEVSAWAMRPDGSLSIVTPAGEETLWGWRSWGLERLDGVKTPF